MKRPRKHTDNVSCCLLWHNPCWPAMKAGPRPTIKGSTICSPARPSRTSEFLDQFSDVKCTEHVRQEKLNKDEKVELKEDSTYDYLVILTNDSGELSLAESRIPIREAKKDRKNTSMLLSNGFATLFLVFHPYYAAAFKFTPAGEEVVAGHTLEKINFQHVPGMKSPAALALRGREYPLELSGTAWIDPQPDRSRKLKLESPTACRTWASKRSPRKSILPR